MIPDVPLPPRMEHLPRDKRGYPIPVIVTLDKNGLPLFTVNDTDTQIRCIRHKLCAICGEKMKKEFWFVGGPGSAFHPLGAYADSAMHHECMTYALKVCPYLAMPRYHSTTLEAKLPGIEERLPGTDSQHVRLILDATQDPARPPLFVAVKAYGQQLLPKPVGAPHMRPLRPYHGVEFWHHGQRLSDYDGLVMIQQMPDLDLSFLRLLVGNQPTR